MAKYVVLCERPGGLYVSERPWDAMDMNTTKRDLKSGHFARPVIVLSLDYISGLCSDVTYEFQRYFPNAPDA
jgi:hypothetical protein